MILGPVFHFELVRIARRWRFYAVRFGFGMILLVIIALNYLSFFDPLNPWSVLAPPPVTLSALARFGQTLCYSMLWAQGILVLLLTPGLVADAIAGERQRKTLHYLMASRLRSAEIVLGKLAARLLHLAVFVGVTLPIMSLLTLVGGVDPVLLGWSFLGTGSTAFLLASIAILTSATTRRPRDAFLASYAFAIFLLVGPSLILSLGLPNPGWWSPILEALSWVNDWFVAASPLGLLIQSNVMALFGLGRGTLLDQIAVMIGLQLAFGLALVVLTTATLRRSYRRIESLGGTRAWRGWTRRWRLRRHRPVGDWPIYWREAFVSGSTAGALRMLVRIGMVLLVGYILVAVLSFAPDAFQEMRDSGLLNTDDPSYRQRSALNWSIRIGSGALFAIWLLTVGARTAGSIASEREEDTWISLLATPMEGPEILWGKMLGVVRSQWPLALPIGLLWVVGLLAGAIHPVGFALGMVGFVLFTSFVVALGTYASLLSKTAWRAQGIVLALLIAPHFCCAFPTPLILTGFGLISYNDLTQIFALELSLPPISQWYDVIPVVYMLFYGVGGPLFYAGATWMLIRMALLQFNMLADRPRAYLAALEPSSVFLATEKPVAKLDPDDLRA